MDEHGRLRRSTSHARREAAGDQVPEEGEPAGGCLAGSGVDAKISRNSSALIPPVGDDRP